LEDSYIGRIETSPYYNDLSKKERLDFWMGVETAFKGGRLDRGMFESLVYAMGRAKPFRNSSGKIVGYSPVVVDSSTNTNDPYQASTTVEISPQTAVLAAAGVFIFGSTTEDGRTSLGLYVVDWVMNLGSAVVSAVNGALDAAGKTSAQRAATRGKFKHPCRDDQNDSSIPIASMRANQPDSRGHHTITPSILRRLPNGVRKELERRARNGNPYIWQIPKGLHDDLHSGAYPGGKYNRIWDAAYENIETTLGDLAQANVNDVVDVLLQVRDEIVRIFKFDDCRTFR
jgi:hypothetical protein